MSAAAQIEGEDFCLGSDSAARLGRAACQLHPNELTFPAMNRVRQSRASSY